MFSEKIKELIQNDLPGEQAHLKMSPLSRPLSSIALENAISYKDSAVAILIFKQEDEHHLVLIQRPSYDGKHSAQVAFPGGKKDESDMDLFQTALRECYEEIGVQLSADFYLGKLTSVFIPVSSFHVEPHVFYLETIPTFKKDEREVEAIFTIKVTDLLDESRVKKTSISAGPNFLLKEVPYFDLENKIIWGATAIMLNELKELLLKM